MNISPVTAESAPALAAHLRATRADALEVLRALREDLPLPAGTTIRDREEALSIVEAANDHLERLSERFGV